MATDTMPDILPGLEPLCIPIENLEELPGNPRVGNVAAVKGSIKRLGVHRAVVARQTTTDKDGRPCGIILVGNHQFKAMRELGYKRIPVIWTDEDDIVAKARALADNHVSDIAHDDPDLLAEMLSYVADDPALLAATSYTQKDIDDLLGVSTHAGDAPVEEPLESIYGVAITCESEEDQVALLKEFTERGLNVRALSN